jgi:hypothetical protein
VLDGVEQTVEAAARAVDAMPRGEETGQGFGRSRLDLLAQEGERSRLDAAKDGRVAPLASRSAGQEFAAGDASALGKAIESLMHNGFA